MGRGAGADIRGVRIRRKGRNAHRLHVAVVLDKVRDDGFSGLRSRSTAWSTSTERVTGNAFGPAASAKTLANMVQHAGTRHLWQRHGDSRQLAESASPLLTA